MKYGIAMFPTDYAIPVTELARATEDLGFESLLFPEHTHIPASRKSAWPGGGELPQEYWHTLDPFVASGAALAVTKTLLVGTGICLVIERDPITLAKEVASVDFLSGGRFIFGIGAGWNIEEMENHGTDPAHRFAFMKESILAMKQIWTQEAAEFHGKYVNFDPIWSYPKPAQTPNPPILIGGGGPHVLDRVVAYGDEWMPNRVRLEELATIIGALQAKATAAGRAPIPVTIFGARPDSATIERYEEAGVTRCTFVIPPVPAEEALPRLTQLAELAFR
jgi:probable F420-dependent oxidoreductase